MLDFQFLNISTLADFFAARPLTANLLVFIVAFLESLAVVGIIMPGAIIMSALGFLIGTSVIPASTTIIWITAGAILGDVVSYLAGVYFQERIHRIWPFTKWPTLLNRSEQFFNRHGGKGVFICRFIGPMRAMIPIIAGACKMPIWRFLFAALPAAALWSVIYMVPGMLLGALSLELPPKLATKFLLAVLIIVALSWTTLWLIKHGIRYLLKATEKLTILLWHFFNRHPRLAQLNHFIADPRKPNSHHQFGLLLALVVFIATTVFVTQQVLTLGPLATLSRNLYYLFSSIRTAWLDVCFLIITFLGDPLFLLLLSGSILGYLIYQKRYPIARKLALTTVIAFITGAFCKICIHVPRPGEIQYDPHSSSFPSAHVLLATAIYGMLSLILAKNLKSQRAKSILYRLTTAIIILIALSRLYLGAHWLCDALAGFLLGMSIILTVTLLQRRKHHHPSRDTDNNLVLPCTMMLVIIWFGYSCINFQSHAKKYKLTSAISSVELSQLLDYDIQTLPFYRLNRAGNPADIFNIVYVGNLKRIRSQLTQHGWVILDNRLTLESAVKMLTSFSLNNHLPNFIPFYRNQKPALSLVKRANISNSKTLVLNLWPANLKLTDSKLPIWLGTLKEQGLGTVKHSPILMGNLNPLMHDLKHSFAQRKNSYDPIRYHQKLPTISWNREILVIRERVSHK